MMDVALITQKVIKNCNYYVLNYLEYNSNYPQSLSYMRTYFFFIKMVQLLKY